MLAKIYNFTPKEIELVDDHLSFILDEKTSLLFIFKLDGRIANKSVVYTKNMTDLNKLSVDQAINGLTLLAVKLRDADLDSLGDAVVLEFCDELPPEHERPIRKLCI